jgi:hypothetical protein
MYNGRSIPPETLPLKDRPFFARCHQYVYTRILEVLVGDVSVVELTAQLSSIWHTAEANR